MVRSLVRSRSAAIGMGIALAASAMAWAEIVSFNPPTYGIGKPIENRDGWMRAPLNEGDSLQYLIESEDNTTGRLHAHSRGQYTLSRAFKPAGRTVEVKWRWRFEDVSDIRFCMGVGEENNLVDPLVKFCVYPDGALHLTSANGSMSMTSFDAVPAVWGYLRLHVNTLQGYWFLAHSASPTRTNETLLIDTTLLPTTNDLPVLGSATVLGRLFLRNEEGGPNAGVDIDDIDWQRADTKVWTGLGRDSTFGLAGNWLPVGVPDSNDVVVFGAAATRNCLLDRNVTVQAVVLQNDFTGLLRLNGYNLNILGGAEFLGGRVQGKNGLIRFRGPNPHPVIGPASDTLPPLALEGSGAMQLFTRTLRVSDFKITGGRLDFNGQNLHVVGDFTVQASEGGHAVGLVALAGRTLTVTGTARLAGTESVKLNLAPDQLWSIAAGVALTVDHATVGRSKATQAQGVASRSVNAGGNENWLFKQAPVLKPMVESITVITGQTAQLKVSVVGATGGETYTWLRNGKALPAADSILHVTATLANHGDVYVCEVANSEGKTQSTPTTLKVTFPAPRSTPEPGEFSGSVRIEFSSGVPNARTYVSATGVNYVEWTQPIETAIDLTLRAYSVLGAEHSDTGTYVFTSTSRPQLSAPIVSPRGKNFAGNLSVRVTHANTGSGITVRYTTDGSAVSDTSRLASGELSFTQTTSLVAVAMASGYRSSTPTQELYLDTASTAALIGPEATPGSGLIDSSIVITLSLPAAAAAPTGSTSTGKIWWRLVDSAWVPYADPGIRLGQKTQFQAVVVNGAKRSDVKTFTYARGLASPLAEPPAQRFRGTLDVTLKAAPGALIYAAVNRTPEAIEADLYRNPITLDNTGFIRTFAVKEQQTSQVSEIIYKLEPETPTASPDAKGLLRPGAVVLRSATTKGQIFYTLNGEEPVPANWIAYADSVKIDSAMTLKALTATGSGRNQLLSAVLTVIYDFSGKPPSATLKPGQTINLAGQWNLHLNSGTTSSIVAEVAADPTGIAGFDGIEAVFTLKGMTSSDLVTAAPDTSDGSDSANTSSSKPLYYLAPGARKPLRITGATPLILPGDGLYFRGNDRALPAVRFAGETVNAERFTVVTFTLDDNAAQVDYKVWRTDKPDEVTEVKSVGTEAVIQLQLKNPPGALPNLGVRICATEAGGTSTSCLPQRAGSFFPLMQHSDGFTTPEVWRIGSQAEDKWDLVGLPFAFDSGITVETLRSLNERDDLAVRRFDASATTTRVLGAKEAMVPGQAYWIASAKPLASARFKSGNLRMTGEESFRFTLKKGWNAIASKQLQALPWIVSRGDAESYRRSRLRGLWQNDPGSPEGWSKTDTLKPWVGYYVWWDGTLDTTVDLDKVKPLAKAAAAGATFGSRAVRDWVIEFKQGGSSLELGAFDGASQGLSFEDERCLPMRQYGQTGASRSSSKGGSDLPALAALRSGVSLTADYVALNPGRVHGWQVHWKRVPGHGLSLPKIELPQGHSLIAISQRRGIAIDLSHLEGQQLGDEAFDAPIGFEDTLSILAGPSDLILHELAKRPARPTQESMRLLGGGRIFLELPGNRNVTLRVVDAKGRLEGVSRHRLASGRYEIAAPRRDHGSGLTSKLGLKWILVEIEGGSTPMQKAFRWAETRL